MRKMRFLGAFCLVALLFSTSFVLFGCGLGGKVTVTYNVITLDGRVQSSYYSQTVNKGEKTTPPPEDSLRSNESMDGWYKDAEYSELFNFETETIDANITLYGRLTDKMLTIKFVTNTDQELSDIKVKYNDHIPFIDSSALVKIGHTQEGWFTDEELTQHYSGDYIREDLTLYLGWNKIAVTSTAYYGNTSKTIKTLYGEKPNLSFNTKMAGMLPDVWCLDEERTQPIDLTTFVMTEPVDIYLRYKVDIENNFGLELSTDATSYEITKFTYYENALSERKLFELPSEFNGKPVTGIKSSAFESSLYDNLSYFIPKSITQIENASFNDAVNSKGHYNTGTIHIEATKEEFIKNVPSSGWKENYLSGVHYGCKCFVSGSFLANEVNDNIEITKYIGNNSNSFIVPSSINGKNVSKITSFALSNTSVDDIFIDNTEGSLIIEDYALISKYGYSPKIHVMGTPISGDKWNYKNLEGSKLTIEQDCNCISGEGYLYSTKDNKVTITSALRNDQTVLIPSELNGLPVVAIGSNAFEHNSELTSVTIPSSVKTIMYQAFANCKNLKSVTFNEGLTTIGSSAFEKTSITSLAFPSSLQTIESDAFRFIKSLQTVKFNEGLTNIGDWSFQGTSITSISIPSSVKVLGRQAFSDCVLLAEVTLNDGLETIDQFAFSRTAIASIYIPTSVNTINGSAFGECKNLEYIYCAIDKKPDGWDDSWNSSIYSNSVIWNYKKP